MGPVVRTMALPDMALSLGSVFALYALTSALWVGIDPLYPITLVIAFLVGYFAKDLRLLWLAACAAIAAFALAQPFLPLAVNPNALGCALALGIAACVAYRLWPFLIVLLPALWLTYSRGAILAAGVALWIGLWNRFRTTAYLCALFAIIAVLAASHDRGESMSLVARMGIWQDTMNHLTAFGSGWGTFANEYASWSPHRNMTGVLASHAYNDLLELTFELGIGVVAFWLMLVSIMDRKGPTKIICWTFIVASLSFFPLYIPGVGHAFAIALGHLARNKGDYNGSLASSPTALPQSR